MSTVFEKVRLSFPRIIKPEVNKSFPNSPAKFSANLIIEPSNPKFAEFMAEVQTLAQKRWKEHATTILGLANQNKKLRCYGAGEEIVNTKTYQVYNGYPGMIYISAASDKDHPPQLVKRDTNGLPVVVHDIERDALGAKMYGGCYVNVAISPWLQDNAGGKAVRCNLIAIEFAGDGEPLGDGGEGDVGSLFGGLAAPAVAPAGMALPNGMAFPGMAPAAPAAPAPFPAGVPSFMTF